MWTWSLLKRNPGGSQVRLCSKLFKMHIFRCLWFYKTAHFTIIFKQFFFGGILFCPLCPFPFLICSPFLPLVWLTSVYGGMGVYLQVRISLITLTMALMKTHGRHIVKNRRGYEWDLRSLQLAQWPARFLWEQFLQLNVNVVYFFYHPGLCLYTAWHLKLTYPEIDLLFWIANISSVILKTL